MSKDKMGLAQKTLDKSLKNINDNNFHIKERQTKH